MEKINRNKFFASFGKGLLVTALAGAVPFKLFSKLSKASGQNKINVAIHPSAIKRNGKVQ